ncbi:MAG: DUF3099 domain-containing protein [Georgenia sp.]
MRGRRSSKVSQVYAITSVRRALSEDVHDRTVRYLVSMGIRTACLLLLFVVPYPWLWLCVVGAAVLPLLAVLVANAGRERPVAADSAFVPPGSAPRLPPAPTLPYDPRTEYLR